MSSIYSVGVFYLKLCGFYIRSNNDKKTPADRYGLPAMCDVTNATNREMSCKIAGKFSTSFSSV